MNAIVLPYPEDLLRLLNVFRFDLSKPQFNNFVEIVGGMILSHNSTISRISQVFGERDASSLNKFLTQSPWDDSLVKKKLHSILFKSMPDLNVFIGDDTMSEKPFAPKMQGVASHYCNLKKKHVNGHSILTTGFASKEGCVPFDAEIYYRVETAKTLGRTFKTKNEMMCEKIESASRNAHFMYAVFDTWYANEMILGKVKELNKKFIVPIKSNRNITMKHEKREIRNHCKDTNLEKYTHTTVDDHLFRYYETEGFIHSIGTVRIFYTQMLQEKENKEVTWSDMYYLITNDFTSSVEFIIHTYLERNQIEVFHREAKQQLGLNTYQTRNIRGIERYLFLVVLTYVLLMLLNKLLIEKKGEKSKTIGELCIVLRAGYYTNLLRTARIANLDTTKRIARNLAYAM